jgi:hypothetical protein
VKTSKVLRRLVAENLTTLVIGPESDFGHDAADEIFEKNGDFKGTVDLNKINFDFSPFPNIRKLDARGASSSILLCFDSSLRVMRRPSQCSER